MRIVVKDHAFGFHLRDTQVDVTLLHLEVGNAVAHQAAGLGEFLVEVHVVAGARAAARTPSPAGPDPTTATFLPVRTAARSGFKPCAMARSAMAHSIDLMVTGFSSMLSVQEASHGAGQTRPVTSGKLLVECRLRAASSQSP